MSENLRRIHDPAGHVAALISGECRMVHVLLAENERAASGVALEKAQSILEAFQVLAPHEFHLISAAEHLVLSAEDAKRRFDLRPVDR